MKKKFSDFERAFSKKYSTLSLGEVLEEMRESDFLGLIQEEDLLMELKEIGEFLEELFIQELLSDEEFLDMEVTTLAIGNHDERKYMLFLEDVENGYFKTLTFSGPFIYHSIVLNTAVTELNLSALYCYTVRDAIELIERMQEKDEW